MLLITQLPPEVVQGIVGSVSPDDLVAVSLTCRWFYHFVKHNSALFRAVYYTNFDAPTKNLDWEREIYDFLKLKQICASENPTKKSELPFVYATAKRILNHSTRARDDGKETLFSHRPFRNASVLGELLGSTSNFRAFLCRSSLFERTRKMDHPVPVIPPVPVEEEQMSAELHSLFGAVQLTARPDAEDVDVEADAHKSNIRADGGSVRLVSAYPFAVSHVYDMRQNSLANGWGPFWADGSGRVDWEKIEAILVVLRYNIRSKSLLKFSVLNQHWGAPFFGSWPGSYYSLTSEMELPRCEPTELDQKDPYGITGTWMRVVCFLDYSDFFRFNFPFRDSLPDNVRRRPLAVGEETRIIVMKLSVVKVEYPGRRGEEADNGQGSSGHTNSNDNDDQDANHFHIDDDPNYPIVHFEGVSYSMDNRRDDNANSDIEGTCRVTKYGDLRWTTHSVFHGQRRWKSESIQLGGIKSGRGVIGNWFDIQYDPQGPCGPTAFWKLHDKKSGEAPKTPFHALSYLMANVDRSNFNIVINLSEPVDGGAGGYGSGGDGDDEDDEEDGDYIDHGGANEEEDSDSSEDEGNGNSNHEHEGDDDEDDGEDDEDDDEELMMGGGYEENFLGIHGAQYPTDIPQLGLLPILGDVVGFFRRHSHGQHVQHHHDGSSDEAEGEASGSAGAAEAAVGIEESGEGDVVEPTETRDKGKGKQEEPDTPNVPADVSIETGAESSKPKVKTSRPAAGPTETGMEDSKAENSSGQT